MHFIEEIFLRICNQNVNLNKNKNKFALLQTHIQISIHPIKTDGQNQVIATLTQQQWLNQWHKSGAGLCL